jgi:hypothetical protein
MSTKPSFLERPNDSRFCALPPGHRVRDVADACRSAALGFAWSAHLGWGRMELARWLVGPYAEAAAATRSMRPSGMRRAVTYRPVAEDAVTNLLLATHERVMSELRTVWSWTHDAASARAWIDDGLVAGIIDDESELGYAPLDAPGMGLTDRVRSLFIADYLTRPADYVAFAVCFHCEGATFDGGLCHVDCTKPRPNTVLRRRVPREVSLPTAAAAVRETWPRARGQAG